MEEVRDELRAKHLAQVALVLERALAALPVLARHVHAGLCQLEEVVVVLEAWTDARRADRQCNVARTQRRVVGRHKVALGREGDWEGSHAAIHPPACGSW